MDIFFFVFFSLKGIYINHGPGENEWFGVKYSDIETLKNLLLEEKNLDIFKAEGLWFGDQHLFRKYGIPVYNFVQAKGDLVIINRGFVYWIKSRGATVNSSWNLFGNDSEQIPIMMNKFNINLQNEMENIINIKTFFWDLFTHLIAFPEALKFVKNMKNIEILAKFLQNFHEEDENRKVSTKNSKELKKMKPVQNISINVINIFCIIFFFLKKRALNANRACFIYLTILSNARNAR